MSVVRKAFVCGESLLPTSVFYILLINRYRDSRGGMGPFSFSRREDVRGCFAFRNEDDLWNEVIECRLPVTPKMPENLFFHLLEK